MYDKAIAALRAQQQAEKNEPLALEELREMNGRSLWAMCLVDPYLNGWGDMEEKLFIGYKTFFAEEDCGKTWLAYRHKPKEEC